VAEQAHIVEARLSTAAENSGDGSQVLRSTGTMTNGAGLLLTSLRGSWTTSRRRGSDDGEGPTVAVARVPGGGGAQSLGRLGHGWGGLGVRRDFK
jgi:hypothetical protein